MFEAHLEARRDPLEIVRQQVLTEVPRRGARRPRHARALVGAEQHAAALLAHVDLALEVDDMQQLGLSGKLRQVLGDDVLVFHREDGEFEPDHAADLTRPQSPGIDNMLGVDVALFGDDVPAAVGALLEIDHAVLAHDLGTAELRRLGVGVRHAVRVDMAFDGVVDGAHEMPFVDERMTLFGLRHVDELEVHAEVATTGDRHLEPVEPLRRAGEHQTAGDVQAAGLSGDLLELLVEVDGVLLELRDVGVAVDRVHAAGGVPGRPGGEFRALDEQDIAPARLGEVVEHAHAHHAAADDDYSCRVLHVEFSSVWVN